MPRPSVFTSDTEYAWLTRKDLVNFYMSDIVSGRLVTQAAPKRPEDCPNLLRVFQWNVGMLWGPYRYRGVRASEAAQCILELEPDVVILQECGNARCAGDSEADLVPDSEGDEIEEFLALLRDAGYLVLAARTRSCNVLATRLQMEQSANLPLSSTAPSYVGYGTLFSAVFASLRMACGCGIDVYGARLTWRNANKWGPRAQQAGVLLSHHAARVGTGSSSPVLIAADFNQPRKQDYTKEEWDLISESARWRGEPEDDGVSALMEADGFSCSLDCKHARRNWPDDAPPPPTHWTSTAIDYVFAKHAELHGNYVVQTWMSDHLPVVTDWEVKRLEKTQADMVQ